MTMLLWLFVVLVIAATAALASRGQSQQLPPPPPDAQWARDPSGRHEFRLWDGRVWTGHVSDQGRAGWDPLT
jgi:hypothetical protein